jgi:hypothetical protein
MPKEGKSQEQQRIAWRAKGIPCPVKVQGDGKESSGEVFIESWSPRVRLIRALKFLGICWGAMVIAVFIPILHFILVPAFFVAGPIVAAIIYQQTSVVLGGFGICPYCGEEMSIVRSRDRWPLDDLCDHCRRTVAIQKK